MPWRLNYPAASLRDELLTFLLKFGFKKEYLCVVLVT